MTEMATLKVPGDYIEAVRQGLLRELKFDGEWLAGQADEANRDWDRARLDPEHAPATGFDPFDCIDGPLAHVQANAAYLRQIADHKGDVTLSGEHHVLKHLAEATGHHQAEKHLAQVDFGGPEAVQAAAIVAWAAGEAERLEVEREAQEAKRLEEQDAEREAVAA